MEDIQISMQDVVDKLRARVSNDAQNIAILEATVEAYKIRVVEMNDEINVLRAK